MGSSWDELVLDNALQEESVIPLNNNTQSGSSEFIDLFSEEENQKSEEPPVSRKNKFRPVKKITAGRVVAMVFTGLLMSFFIFLIVYGLYTRYIRFPSEQVRVWEESRLYAVQNFYSEVNDMAVSIEGSYIMQELPYANGNKYREDFMKYVLGTVSYSTDIVNKKNVFGNDLIDKDTGDVLTEESWLSEEENAYLHFIDYQSIDFDSGVLSTLISNANLTAEDIDYRNKLTDLFCQYICSIDVEKLPLVSIERVPQLMWEDTGYKVLLSEDIYIDNCLFSSKELYDCFERFSEAVARELDVGLTVSSEYKAWESQCTEEYAPPKYGKYSIGHMWCGAYYLTNEYAGEGTVVTPQLGDGSKEQPASLNTPVITYVIQTGENGEEVKLPIRVTMVEFGVSQEAIDWFQEKHIQNRGYDVTSELQYCYFVFEVTNLSNETLTIYDNTALCDSNANCSSRTGTIYGLQSSVTLDPEETGIIESWGRSTELNLKYVIWGADFARRIEPVWFRVLAGDLEDSTWEKGVYINDTRGE